MSATGWYIVIGIGGVFLAALTFWFTFIYPKQRLRGRALDSLLGHDGADGLPRQKSVFQRLDDQDAKLDKISETVSALAAEFPKNGIPTRAAVDNLAERVKNAAKQEELRWASITAALLANNIKVTEI